MIFLNFPILMSFASSRFFCRYKITKSLRHDGTRYPLQLYPIPQFIEIQTKQNRSYDHMIPVFYSSNPDVQRQTQKS